MSLKFLKKNYEKIRMTFFGINMIINTDNMKFFHKIILFSSGPIFNIIMYLMFNELEYLATANLYIAVVNLLPIIPLDGGNITREIITLFLEKNKASKLCIYINYIFIIICFLTISDFPVLKIIVILITIVGIKEENEYILNYSVRKAFLKYTC